MRAMASNVREAKTKDERALCAAAAEAMDVETLTSLLHSGVFPNVQVC